ncbi:phage tail sheath C-terminal domain-containing protein [Methylopila sp. M107]|uniref:phage tail sheath family protein n=1 Tax=Methylopila sp. M107 TaxID=1101190 RepID=UPI0003698C7B|nr:phage tail sheath C-terminal domain-containing protein [Methylopila sp. M107]
MYQHPGVYIEHVPSGLLSIEAASTSVAAFIGQVKRGAVVTKDAGEPAFVSSASLFASQFGALDGAGGGIRDEGEDPDWFGHAVVSFFGNGGSKAYIIPVGDPTPALSATAGIVDPNDAANAFYFTAASPGAWPNDVFVGLKKTLDDPDDLLDEYELTVGYKPDLTKPIEAIERITGITLNPASGRYIVSKVADGSAIVTVERKAIAGAGGGGKLKATLGAPVAAFGPGSLLATDSIVVAVNAASVTVPFDGTEASLAAVAAKIQKTVRESPTPSTGKTGFVCQVTKDNRLVFIPGGGVAAPLAVVSGGAAALKLGLDPTVAATVPPGALDLAGLDTKTLDIKVGAAAVKTVTFAAPIADLAAVATQIQTQMQANPNANANFRASIEGGRLLLRSEGGAAANAVVVSGGTAAADLGLADAVANSSGRANLVDYPQPFDAAPDKTTESRLTGGVDFGAPKRDQYEAAYFRLRDYRDVSIILLPGHAWIEGGDNAIIEDAVTHAEFMQNRMVIVDPPNSVGGAKLVTAKDVKDLGAPTSPYTALYYPWLTVTNPHYDKDVAANKPKTFDIPPSSFAAGMWARIDASRGVWKAPAGLEATVRGTQGPNVLIGNDVQDNLNEFGVNCLRAIIGPTVIWGARTLATKSKPEFRYVPVRRTQSMIGESLYSALQAVVFEPNDHKLWASLRGSVGDFMDGLFRAGAFQGEKASDAYYVRCGLGATMTQGDIDGGIVRVVVGFAPLKPAEFVVVQIQQIVGQRG